MSDPYEQWAVWTTVQCGGTRKGPAVSIIMLQTLLVSQSYKHWTSTLPPHLKNICFMLFLIEDSCLIDPGSAACRVRRERKKSIWISGCSAVSKFRRLSLFSFSFKLQRTALCPNFEEGPWGHSSPSCNRQLCYSTRKLDVTPLLGQLA